MLHRDRTQGPYSTVRSRRELLGTVRYRWGLLGTVYMYVPGSLTHSSVVSQYTIFLICVIGL